ncbi:MAG: hypothetical protein AAGE84_13300 [Cyanobacteria bacterium P01_G01_bin.39]
MNQTIIIAIIIAIVLIIIVYIFRDRMTELSVDGKQAKMAAKMAAKEQTSEIEDDQPVNVVFKGNKLRGEGEYRMRGTNFSENDVDGKQKLELGYDETSHSEPDEEN